MQWHTRNACARVKERDLLRRRLSEDQVQAVLMNDFNSMLYTTYTEHYREVKNPAQGVLHWKDASDRSIVRKQITQSMAVNYIRAVPATAGELFYLRALLKVSAVRSFSALQRDPETGVMWGTFQEAAKARNIVAQDAECFLCLNESKELGSTPSDLRKLFVFLITRMPNVRAWELFCQFAGGPGGMDADCDGHQHRVRGEDQQWQDVSYEALAEFPDDSRLRRPAEPDSKYNHLLWRINDLLRAQSTTNEDVGLPAPLQMQGRSLTELQRHQRQYCGCVILVVTVQLQQYLLDRIPRIAVNPEQREFFWDLVLRLKHVARAKGYEDGEQRWNEVYDALDEEHQDPQGVQRVRSGLSNTLFLEAKGGRGKTYVLNPVIAVARLLGIVALPACFTGLAA